jgi:hypothetical protein
MQNPRKPINGTKKDATTNAMNSKDTLIDGRALMGKEWFIMLSLFIQFFKFRKITPATISKMPVIFIAVKASLNTIKEAVKINIYTKAVVRGMMYPRS